VFHPNPTGQNGFYLLPISLIKLFIGQCVLDAKSRMLSVNLGVQYLQLHVTTATVNAEHIHQFDPLID